MSSVRSRTEYTVELRIEGEELDPQSVTRDLGLAPSILFWRGEKRATGVLHHNIWTYSGAAEGSPGPRFASLEDGLIFLLEKLEPIGDPLRVYAEAYEAFFWCGHFQNRWNSEYRLTPGMLRRLGDLGIAVHVDSYCPVGEASEE